MNEMIDNIAETMMMFGIATVGMFWLLIYVTIKLKQIKEKRKMNRIPIDIDLLDEAVEVLERIDNPTEAASVLLEKLKYMQAVLESKNIDNLIEAIDKPLQSIAVEFFNIIKDKKVSLKDSGSALRIIADTSKIARNFEKLKIEAKDVDFDELEIVLLEVLKNVREARKEMI